ncbi:UPF0587 protein like [Heracleum sosnowskyi]|uniref:UPF0587 protein like n=1 Tax=Heracleum sosnowskyi TaxID=360622 RepID=A0AAD8HKS4_9APIA|nr:UPF0587 protein like [Heracleum sosnowskyi]
MVRYRVLFTADLQNLTKLQPAGGVESPAFAYYFKMKCGNCGEPAKKEISVLSNVKLSDSRNAPNLVMKCKFCERRGSMTVVTTDVGKPLTEELSALGESAPLMELDCKGFDPVDLVFGYGWKAESIAGTKFKDIDLSDGEFAEYDEMGNCPVAIYNFCATFEVLMSEYREWRLARSIRIQKWHLEWEARAKANKKEYGVHSYFPCPQRSTAVLLFMIVWNDKRVFLWI